MEHDFYNPKYCKTLEDLFKPGSGVRPPAFTGRDKEQVLMNKYLRMIQGSTDSNEQLLNPIPHDVVIYGPRGNGKTVLLDQFQRTCREQGVHVVSLRPKSLINLERMIKRLLFNDDDEMINLLKKAKPDALSVNVPGLAKAEWKALSMSEKDQIRVDYFEELLRARCRTHPLVITVDEAHTLEPEIGALLLNTSEELRKNGIRCLTVLAGTPDIRSELNKIGATFWGRSKKLAIGRLDEMATIEALKKPLEALSVKFDTDALEQVVKDTQNYPYFIQLWGKALCDVLVKNKEGHTVTVDVVDEARLIVKFERDDYYQDRYKELRKQKLLSVAEVVANIFKGQDLVHEEGLFKALRHELDLEESACEEQLEELFNLGFIWQSSPNDFYEPGIPSLMTHVQERAQIREATPNDIVRRD